MATRTNKRIKKGTVAAVAPEVLNHHLWYEFILRLPLNVIWRLIGINTELNKIMKLEILWKRKCELEFGVFPHYELLASEVNTHKKANSSSKKDEQGGYRRYFFMNSENGYGKLFGNGILQSQFTRVKRLLRSEAFVNHNPITNTLPAFFILNDGVLYHSIRRTQEVWDNQKLIEGVVDIDSMSTDKNIILLTKKDKSQYVLSINYLPNLDRAKVEGLKRVEVRFPVEDSIPNNQSVLVKESTICIKRLIMFESQAIVLSNKGQLYITNRDNLIGTYSIRDLFNNLLTMFTSNQPTELLSVMERIAEEIVDVALVGESDAVNMIVLRREGAVERWGLKITNRVIIDRVLHDRSTEHKLPISGCGKLDRDPNSNQPGVYIITVTNIQNRTMPVTRKYRKIGWGLVVLTTDGRARLNSDTIFLSTELRYTGILELIDDLVVATHCRSILI